MKDQNGEEVINETLFTSWGESATDEDRDTAICLILQYLGKKVVRTNATKRGIIELQLQDDA